MDPARDRVRRRPSPDRRRRHADRASCRNVDGSRIGDRRHDPAGSLSVARHDGLDQLVAEPVALRHDLALAELVPLAEPVAVADIEPDDISDRHRLSSATVGISVRSFG